MERAFPPKPVREKWKEYFQHNPQLGRAADGHVLAQEQDLDLFAGLDGPKRIEEVDFEIAQPKPSTSMGLDGVSLADIKTMNRVDLVEVLNGMLN